MNVFHIFWLFFTSIQCSNILIISPIFGYSHVKFMSKLADIVANGGHNVTVLQPHHLILKKVDGLVKNKNVQIINYYPSNYEELKNNDVANTFPQFWDSPLMNNPVLGAIMMSKMLVPEFKNTAQQILRDKQFLQSLKDKKFDVVMSETFEITGLYIAHLIGVPSIPIMSAVRFPGFQNLFGQPSNLGYVPQTGSAIASKAGFWDRLNDVYYTFFMRIGSERFIGAQYDMISEAVDEPVPYWKDIAADAPIYITNSNPLLDFAVPMVGNIIQVGGITIPKEKKVEALPEEYEKILKERESTVLISFGSVVRSYEMPDNFKSGVIEMFHNLPDVTFIWKYEKDDDELEKRLPNNVHLKKWVPQPALLADDRLKVFVTHGGLGSTMEVAYSGKPAVMIPLFGDQFHNAQMLSRHGGAVAYSKYDLPNASKLTAVISDMVHDIKYEQNSKQLLNRLENQPIDPTVNLLKHIEYAIKFPNVRSQVPEISGVNWISFYYLDVLVFLSIMGIAGIFVSIRILSCISKRFILKNKTKTE